MLRSTAGPDANLKAGLSVALSLPASVSRYIRHHAASILDPATNREGQRAALFRSIQRNGRVLRGRLSESRILQRAVSPLRRRCTKWLSRTPKRVSTQGARLLYCHVRAETGA